MSDRDTLYARWLSGDITEAELDELRQSGELDELESIVSNVDSWTLPEIDRDGALQQIINHPKKTRTRPKIVRLIWGTAAAASIILAVSVFTILKQSNTTIRVDYAENTTHLLPDGSSVSLNDGSSLRLNKRSWDENRQIRLTGEATFDVLKGSMFTVNTQIGHVEVLGTSFNIRSWEDDLVVECYSGKVRVTREGNVKIIAKGQGVKIKDSGVVSDFSVDHSRPTWESGSSKFTEADINDVFREIERQFDIEIQNPASDRLFTGTFDHVNLSDALNQICAPLNLQYTIDQPNKSVTITEKQ